MHGLDIAVLIIVGLAAVGGVMRGFVQEILSLAAWIAAVVAIRLLHTDLTEGLLRFDYFDDPISSGTLAFALLLLVPYRIIKLVARWAGKRSRASVLGPVDRILGLGFGILKGLILVVLAFSILVLGYDRVWGEPGRPAWISQATSYPLINAASQDLVEMIEAQRAQIRERSEAAE